MNTLENAMTCMAAQNMIFPQTAICYGVIMHAKKVSNLSSLVLMWQKTNFLVGLSNVHLQGE